MNARRSGFTLLEVLVALAVLAIGLGSAIRLAAGGVETVAELRARAVAGWVAENRIERLALAADWPALGGVSGETAMAARRWRWRQTVSATADGGLRRVRVQVSAADGGAPLADQTAFLGRR